MPSRTAGTTGRDFDRVNLRRLRLIARRATSDWDEGSLVRWYNSGSDLLTKERNDVEEPEP